MEQLETPWADKIVVIVEDEFLIRELVMSELEDCGYTVVGFDSADAALPYLRQHGGDVALIVTDVQMPGKLDGLALLDILTRLWPRVPVLVTSGGPLVDPRQLPRHAAFISKPWRPDEMVARVNRIVEIRH